MNNEERTEPFLTDNDWDILQQVCREVGVSADIVERMLIAENRVYGMGRRHGINEALEDLITEGLGKLATTAEEAR